MPARARHPCPICGREAPPPGRDGGHPQPPGAARSTIADPLGPAPSGAPTPRPGASFPFCSPACKLVDLGRWLDGEYRVPGPPLESTLSFDGDDGRHSRDDE